MKQSPDLEPRVITHFGPSGNMRALHHHAALYHLKQAETVERCGHEHPSIGDALRCGQSLLKQKQPA